MTTAIIGALERVLGRHEHVARGCRALSRPKNILRSTSRLENGPIRFRTFSASPILQRGASSKRLSASAPRRKKPYLFHTYWLGRVARREPSLFYSWQIGRL